jgi:hypothetical protein
MKTEALFLNGVYEAVLQEILAVQAELPEQIMFLQPYKGEAIAKLRDNPPSVDDPMLLLMSLTGDLPTVHYRAEIVGWDDKRHLDGVDSPEAFAAAIHTLGIDFTEQGQAEVFYDDAGLFGNHGIWVEIDAEGRFVEGPGFA